ncbi:MAG: HAMP domain-containing sensor histidine kinase [Thermodesulfobacteriota bacterium]
MTTLSLLPVWLIDIIGSALMIVGSALCLRLAYRILARDEEDPLATYLVWFCGALFAFALSRAIGHIVKHLLVFAGRPDLWQRLSPVSGSINTLTFVVIASVTLFFQRMQAIIHRMARDRDKIERTGRELLDLNRALESTVFERTRVEMALRVAHDIRNPAAIIGGLVRRMAQEADQAPATRGERLALVREQVERLEELVGRFESISPGEPGAFVPLDLGGLAEECVALLTPEAAEKGVVLSATLSPALLLFQGNERLMKIAVMHLIRNSIEACQRGEAIRLTTELAAGGVLLRIEDNGPGIPAERLGRILSPTAAIDRRGTGLGLSYVKQIIEDHRGELRIGSQPGKGTTVEVMLPTHLGVLRERELR